MKAVILDAVGHIVGVAHVDVVLRGVEHVGDPGTLQVGQVTDCLPVTDDDPSTDLRSRTLLVDWLAGWWLEDVTLLQSTGLFFSLTSPLPEPEAALLSVLLSSRPRPAVSRLDCRHSLRPARGELGGPTSCREEPLVSRE